MNNFAHQKEDCHTCTLEDVVDGIAEAQGEPKAAPGSTDGIQKNSNHGWGSAGKSLRSRQLAAVGLASTYRTCLKLEVVLYKIRRVVPANARSSLLKKNKQHTCATKRFRVRQ